MDDDKMCQEGKPSRTAHFMEQTGLARKKTDSVGLATSRWLYIKHIGYNDIQVSLARYQEYSSGKSGLARYFCFGQHQA